MRVLLLIIIGEEKRKRRAVLILLYRFPLSNNDLSTSFVSDLVIVSQSAAIQQRMFKCLVFKLLSYPGNGYILVVCTCDPFGIAIFTLGCDPLEMDVTNGMAFNKFPSTSVFHRTTAINNRLRPVS